MIVFAPEDVAAARLGSRAALERIVRAAERPVMRLALRMLADRAEAEDAAQEILIRIVTHLGSVREEQAAGAWAFRLACRHLERERRRGRVEAMRLSFEGFAEDLERGLAPPDEGAPGLTAAETALAVEEVKTGCTLAMLSCLGRGQRIAYILGDVFEMTDSEAAAALGLAPPAYRQRLRRARAAVADFVGARCGIVAPGAACSCPARVAPALAAGRIDVGVSAFGLAGRAREDRAALEARVRALEGARAAAALMRASADFPLRAGILAQRIASAWGESPALAPGAERVGPRA